MMIQTMTNRRHAKLLAERLDAGRRYVDALCHGNRFAEAEMFWARMEELDDELLLFGRLTTVERGQISMAEDARWYVPGQAPAEGHSCTHCARGDLGAAEQLADLTAGFSWFGEAA